MPILRPESHVDYYRLCAAHKDDIHELTGRGPDSKLTKFVVRRIAAALTLGSNDVVVDVGCGDGAFAAFAAPAVANTVGIAPNDEEIGRLRAAHAGVGKLQFVRGRLERIPLPDGYADKVVCNSALKELPEPGLVPVAVNELARVTKPGGLLWIGEVPMLDEHHGIDATAKGLRGLLNLLRGAFVSHTGFRPWPLACRAAQMLYCRVSAKRFYIVMPKKTIAVTPDELVPMFGRAGVRLIRQERTLQPQVSRTRLDYLFCKD